MAKYLQSRLFSGLYLTYVVEQGYALAKSFVHRSLSQICR